MKKIYFGNVIVQDTRTGTLYTVDKKIYLETDTPPALRLRPYVLKHIQKKEQEKYKIIRFCFENAIITGVTAY